jgi:hypothetical protein
MLGELAPPHGVDAGPDAMKAPRTEPMLDRLRAKPEFKQLASGDDAMLALRELPDLAARKLKDLPPYGVEDPSTN